MLAKDALRAGGKLVRRFRVIADWEATYEDPIVLKADEEFWLSGKTDDWDGHVWLWAKNQSDKEGWIPDSLVRKVAGKTYANADFSAIELTCRNSEVLDASHERNGWVLCRAASGSSGWVPVRNLQEL
ncbi:SH3 domain-containing protein [uncultured Tateyamaria sp.]|uniref:SH3 domain-containing protein n=1 Tax=uncultured Tateyamaria sp. TaxID=455651 RepID=UPI0034437397